MKRFLIILKLGKILSLKFNVHSWFRNNEGYISSASFLPDLRAPATNGGGF